MYALAQIGVLRGVHWERVYGRHVRARPLFQQTEILREDVTMHQACHIGQAKVPAREAVGQLLVVHP